MTTISNPSKEWTVPELDPPAEAFPPEAPPRRRRRYSPELAAAAPITPYTGPPAHSRTATVYADLHGITALSLRSVLDLLWWAGYRGCTAPETHRAIHDFSPGRLSSALSSLATAGHIVMLAEIREGAHIYVWPDSALGRTTARGHRTRRNSPP